MNPGIEEAASWDTQGLLLRRMPDILGTHCEDDILGDVAGMVSYTL